MKAFSSENKNSSVKYLDKLSKVIKKVKTVSKQDEVEKEKYMKLKAKCDKIKDKIRELAN